MTDHQSPPPLDPDALGPDALELGQRLELLTAYLDGELSADQAREVTAWLERHPEALREVEHQRRLWDLLGRYGEEPVPAGFAERAVAASGAHRAVPVTPASPRLARRRWALAAAAAVLLALGAFALGRRGADVPPGTTEVAALESVDLDFIQHANVDELLALSDEQFAALLAGDPDALADEALGEAADGARGG
jgi:anti-sigma factor RsiW